MTECRDYDFCQDIACEFTSDSHESLICCEHPTGGCIKTAKQFHKWLLKKGFVIAKLSDDEVSLIAKNKLWMKND